MTPGHALAEAHRAGVTGRFDVALHARQRQNERNVHRDDIREALRTATVAESQEKGRWRLIGGRDLDGDHLALVVSFEDGVVVITVY